MNSHTEQNLDDARF